MNKNTKSIERKLIELVNHVEKQIDLYTPCDIVIKNKSEATEKEFNLNEEINNKIKLNHMFLKREIKDFIKHEFSPIKPILKGEQKDSKYEQYFECPVCGRKMYCEFDNYCKDCGTQMDWSR